MKKKNDPDMLTKLTNIRHVSQYGISHDIVESQNNELSRIDNMIAQSVSKYHNSASHQNAISGIKSLVDGANNAMDAESHGGPQSSKMFDVMGISETNEASYADQLIQQTVTQFEKISEFRMAVMLVPEMYKCITVNADAILNPDTHSDRIIGVKYSKELSSAHQTLFKNINDDIINDHKLEESISSWVEDALIDGSKPVMINKLNFDVLKAVGTIINTQNPHTIQLEDIDNLVPNNLHNVTTSASDISMVTEGISTEDAISQMMIMDAKSIGAMVSNKENRVVAESFRTAVYDTLKDEGALKRVTDKFTEDLATKINENISFHTPEALEVNAIANSYIHELKSNPKYKDGMSTEDVAYLLDITNHDYSDEVEMTMSIEEMEDLNPEDISEEIAKRTTKRRKGNVSVASKGVVYTPLSPDKVVPIMVDGRCVGYYVIERDENGMGSTLGAGPQNSTVDSLFKSSLLNGAVTANQNTYNLDHAAAIPFALGEGMEDGKSDILRQLIMKSLASKANDPSIINSPSFNNLVYSLLRENYIIEKKIRISYVPVERMCYIAPRRDSNSGIGISLLDKALFHIYVYLSSLITNLMIKVSKSADKEKYVIPIGEDADIEQQIENFYRVIKSKDTYVGQLGTVTGVLRKVGKFQRILVPEFDGEELIKYDQIQGQDVNMDDELMEYSLRSAVQATGTPTSMLDVMNDDEYARGILAKNATYVQQIRKFHYNINPELTKLIARAWEYRYSHYVQDTPEWKKATRIGGKGGGKVSGKSKILKDGKREADIVGSDLLAIITKYIIVFLPEPMLLQTTNQMDTFDIVESYAEKMVELMPFDDDGDSKVEMKKKMFKLEVFKEKMPHMDFAKYEKMFKSACRQVNEYNGFKDEEGDGY